MLEGLMRTRWRVVAAYLLGQGAVMYIGPALLFQDWPDFDGSFLFDVEYLISVLIAWVIVCVLQALFLLPVRSPAPIGPRGKSLFVSVVLAAFLSAVLLTGLCWSVIYTFFLYTNFPHRIERYGGWLLIGGLAVSWLAATPLLWAFAKNRRRETVLGRIASRLFLGTVVEAVAVIPLDVMVRRKESCYCGAGTFWSLLACGGIGVFALGPAILLPLITRRRKRWYAGRCEVCGYDMTGTPKAERCPECGAGWRPPTEPMRCASCGYDMAGTPGASKCPECGGVWPPPADLP